MKNRTYSDGDDIEERILELFKKNLSPRDIEIFLKKNNEWPFMYHLSPERHNLLSWYSFAKGKSLLEIGAGCGALTGLFINQKLNVTSVELSDRRSEIIRNRFISEQGLRIFSGDIMEQTLNEKFEYVTLIGVLEYAGKYIKSKSPFLDLLKRCKEYLTKDGVLIIAIENRFGLKYWRGAPEDHTNRFFDSLEGYPKYSGVRTFGMNEMKDLLVNVGFSDKNTTFYYPIPDYKFCYELFSEEYAPSGRHKISSVLYPSPHPVTSFHLFDEYRVSEGIQENSMFDFFANSFLIFLRNE